MEAQKVDVERARILAGWSDSSEAIEAVLGYLANPYDPNKLPQHLQLPFDDEPHVGDWQRYRDEAAADLWGHLQNTLPQWNIPIRPEMAASPAYADVARRGRPFREENFGGRLTLERPEALRLDIHTHWAGALPVLSTTERADFETLYCVLAKRCEPAEIDSAVNALLVAGYINWERLARYRQSWSASFDDEGAAQGWPAEMRRVAQSETWRIHDKIMLTYLNPYSDLSAEDLGLPQYAETWLCTSTALRLEHEFTHYATKRIYGTTQLNLWEETICDFMGMTLALGEYRADWFLAFLGLDAWPELPARGRYRTYTGDLDGEALRLVCEVVVHAAHNVEQHAQRFYRPDRRQSFYLAMTLLPFEFLGADDPGRFEACYRRADALLSSP